MTKRIVLEESDEPIRLPDCNHMIELHEAIRALRNAFEAESKTNYAAVNFGCVRWLDNALYDLWGCVGELAQAEGLLDRARQGKDPTCVLCDAGEDHEH